MPLSIRNIIRKGTSDCAVEDQRVQFLSLFHKPELEFELKNQLLDDLDQTNVSTVNKPFFDELFEKWWVKRRLEITLEQKRNHLVLRLLQWAAILAFGLFFGFYLHSGIKGTSPVYYTSFAPKGSIAEMFLPDGSHIFLNSGSEIKYSVDGADGTREVFLTGEAWFHVAKMKSKPFLVHTAIYDVKVTGTSFNVKAYQEDDAVITTLEEGSVKIQSEVNPNLIEEKNLNPGQQLICNKKTGTIRVDEVNSGWYTSWKENKLVFINMSLKDLMAMLERKYGVDIQIVDKDILEYHYDGIIKNETILEVLDILKHTLPIEYKIVGQNIVIQRKEARRR
ncbi:MAG: DUF4974 domain-containing protein [Prolixibacteraceae bacterium]|jgi:ferric-dicitrate binding protein FerR (iron transport regulator)|nr:DUF4974 domain-containing protein [Prolixibacteraceae bacterium]